ncbi:MAG: DUF2807 domain-containing protein [Altererythrobacter sp.]|nr:DUF2807 domain-containing protein [Altererythrobacter sp.]
MLQQIFKRVAPVAALALGTGVAGCDVDVSFNGEEGVSLAELDMSGDAPTGLALLGPDAVIITQGESLNIDLEGDPQAVEAMRFTLEGGTLGILRDSDVYDGNGQVTVRVTMPAPSDLTMAGSGTIESDALASSADITSAGSGSINVTGVEAEDLEITIAGSGSTTASGTTDRLEVTIAGSGGVNMPELKAEEAEVSIAGSGSVAFSSDGKVEANIMGSGSVVVAGDATCELNSMGSGTLSCNSVSDAPAEGTEEAEPTE